MNQHMVDAFYAGWAAAAYSAQVNGMPRADDAEAAFEKWARTIEEVAL